MKTDLTYVGLINPDLNVTTLTEWTNNRQTSNNWNGRKLVRQVKKRRKVSIKLSLAQSLLGGFLPLGLNLETILHNNCDMGNQIS